MKYCLILVCAFQCLAIQAQDNTPDSEIKEIKKEVSRLYASGDLDSLLYYKDQLCKLYRAEGLWEKLVYEYTTSYRVFKDKDDLQQAQAMLDSAIHISAENLDSTNVQFFYSRFTLGNFYLWRKNYNRARELIEYAVYGMLENGNPPSHVYRMNGTLSRAYAFKGNYLKAISTLEFFNRELEKDSSNLSEEPFIFNGIYIAEYLYQNKEYTKSIEQAKQTLKRLSSTLTISSKSKIQNKANLFHILARSYAEVNDLQNAKLAIEEAKRNFNIFQGEIPYHVYETTSSIAFNKNSYQEAIEEQRKGLLLYNKSSFSKDKVRAIYLSWIADYHQHLDQMDSAKFYIDKAIHLVELDPSPDKRKFFIEQIKQLDFNQSNLEIIEKKARISKRIFDKTKDKTNLDEAEQWYGALFAAAKWMSYEYDNQTQLNLLERMSSYFEDYLSLVLEKNELQKGEKAFNQNLEQAFLTVEEYNSNLIRQIIDLKSARENSKIDPGLLKQEDELKSSISFYQRKVFENLEDPNMQSKIGEWKNRLLKLDNDYVQLQQTLEQKHPAYFALKYSGDDFSLESLQKNLNPDEVLLEYYFHKEHLLLFSIRSNEIKLFDLGLSQKMEIKLNRLLKNISTQPFMDDFEIKLQEFKEDANGLYEILLGKVSSKIKAKNLIVIPQGNLSYLPFEILLTERNEESNYKKISYLFKQSSVRYAYSARTYLDSRLKENTNNGKVISFAPTYTGKTKLNKKSRRYQELRCNSQESAAVLKHFDGSAYLASDATKSSFEEARNFQLIHLAAHAEMDLESPEFSRIEFSDDYLPLLELFHQNLNADLAVLSACNTGVGSLAKGEGVISLGKGFMSSGVKSLLTSLWSINDCSTSEVINHFFDELADGSDKDQALVAAKVNYLDQTDNLHAHPYFWSGLVLVGDSQPLASTRNLWSYGLLIILIGLILVLFAKFRKK